MGYSCLAIKTEVSRLEMYNFLGETIANLSNGILTFKPQGALELVRGYNENEGGVYVPLVDFIERLGLPGLWLGYFAKYLDVKELPTLGAALSIEMYLGFKNLEKIRKNFGYIPNYALKIDHILGREENQLSDGTFMRKVAVELTKKYGDKITNLSLDHGLDYGSERGKIEILK